MLSLGFFDSTTGAGGDPAGRTPDSLGGLLLGEELGGGGMGRVYRAHNPLLRTDVAVKVMQVAADRSRFITEMRLAARIEDPRIVRIRHAAEDAGRLYLVMDLLPGPDLKRLVRKHGRLPWQRACAYALQAARGVAAAHAHGIIHRDIKPSNLILAADGGVCVADLGVAKALDGRRAVDEEVTGDRDIVGTTMYMAPEQAVDPRRATPACDVYSLGATLFFLLCGESPHRGRSLADLIRWRGEGERPDPRRLVPEVPAPVAEAVLRLLAFDPDQRPADGAAAVAVLEAALAQPAASRGSHQPSPLLRRWPWLAAAAAGLVAATVVLPGGDQTALAGAAPGVPPPAAAAGAADAGTPQRALFTLVGELPAEALAQLTTACMASGLPVIERARVDALVGEQRLVVEGRIDQQKAARVGQLLGGHIALFAEPAGARVGLRCVLVETGEVVAAAVVAPDEVAAAAGQALTAAAGLLPLRAQVDQAGAAIHLRAGARHGLHAGDRVSLRRDALGAEVASATVLDVQATHAGLRTEPAGLDARGLVAVRESP